MNPASIQVDTELMILITFFKTHMDESSIQINLEVTKLFLRTYSIWNDLKVICHNKKSELVYINCYQTQRVPYFACDIYL